MKLRAGIVGISGYAGVELHRILSAHPSVSLAALAAGRAAGSALGASWPGLEGYPLQDIDTPEPARLAAVEFASATSFQPTSDDV